jgi:hypothetical protein
MHLLSFDSISPTRQESRLRQSMWVQVWGLELEYANIVFVVVQLTGLDECSRHVMPIPMIITRCSSGSRNCHSNACQWHKSRWIIYSCVHHLSPQTPPDALTGLATITRMLVNSVEVSKQLASCAHYLSAQTSPDTLLGLAISSHTFTRRWQHARGLHITT